MRPRAIILLFLTWCWTAFAQFGASSPGWPCATAPQYYAHDYCSWAFDTNQASILQKTASLDWKWGGPSIWDASASLYRLYAQSTLGSTNVVMMLTSTNSNVFCSPATAVISGSGSGNWDGINVGVPFAWYEAGETRPWRMLYIGSPSGVNYYGMGLATSLDGVTWERKDTAGNALTIGVLTNTWLTDFGNVFKVGNIYYCYHDTITVSARVLRLATSTDLVTWTRYEADKVLFAGKKTAGGAWDYDDATHTGFASEATFGWFCPWVGRWDRKDGIVEYRMYVCTYNTPAEANTKLVCFTSPSPIFEITNRTYRGDVFDCAMPPGHYLVTNQISKVDVARVACADITQNATSLIDPSMWVSCCSSNGSAWWETQLRRPGRLPVASENVATTGATLSNCDLWSNEWRPAIQLSYLSTTGTVYQFCPGRTGAYQDASGNGTALYPGNIIPYQGTVTVSSLGALFAGAAGSWLGEQYNTSIPVWTTFNKDFTIEFTADKSATIGNGNSYIAFQNGISVNTTSTQRCLIQFDGSVGDTAVKSRLYINDDTGVKRNHFFTFDWSDNRSIAFACSVAAGKVYWFTNGIAANAGGTAFDYTLFGGAAYPCIGAVNGGGTYYNGHIDELRYSNYGLYTTDYTVVPIPFSYQTSGYVYTGVFDTGINTYPVPVVSSTIPAGCAVTVTHRIAASATDKSVTSGDFSAGSSMGRYHQWCLNLTGPGSTTPVVTNFAIRVWQ